MSDISSILSSEIDILDKEILLLVTKGNLSSYAVWAAMNRQMHGQGLAYVNVKKRIKRMVSMGLIQKSEPASGTTNIRGRKEYKLIKKGSEHLIDYLISHWNLEDIKSLTEYGDSADREAFETLLRDKILRALEFANIYYKHADKGLVISSKVISNIRIEEIKEPQEPIIITTASDYQSKRRKKY